MSPNEELLATARRMLAVADLAPGCGDAQEAVEALRAAVRRVDGVSEEIKLVGQCRSGLICYLVYPAGAQPTIRYVVVDVASPDFREAVARWQSLCGGKGQPSDITVDAHWARYFYEADLPGLTAYTDDDDEGFDGWFELSAELALETKGATPTSVACSEMTVNGAGDFQFTVRRTWDDDDEGTLVTNLSDWPAAGPTTEGTA